MKVKLISGVSSVIVEVTEAFAGRSYPSVKHFVVHFSPEEDSIIYNALKCPNKPSYDWWRTRRDNIVCSKVRKSIDLNLGTSFQSRIVEIKVLG